MKQNPKYKKGPRAAKKATQFNIELDVKSVTFFLVLIGLTAVTVFYLGVLFGKASRDPNTRVTSTMTELPNETAIEAVTPNDLNIFDLKDEADSKELQNDIINNLKLDSQRVMEEADEILKESEQSGNASTTVPTANTTPVEKPEEEADSFVPSWPENSQQAKPGSKLFTIQVIATSNETKAKDLVRQLRLKSFDAYIQEFTIEGKLIYRVRVGRANKSELDEVMSNLNKAIGGMGQKPRIVQAN